MTKAFLGPVELNGKKYEIQGNLVKQKVDEWGEASPQTTEQTHETRRFLQVWHTDTVKGLLADRDYNADLSMAYDSTLETRFPGQLTLGPKWGTSFSSDLTSVSTSAFADVVGPAMISSVMCFATAHATTVLCNYHTGTAWATENVKTGMTTPLVHDVINHGGFCFVLFSDGVTLYLYKSSAPADGFASAFVSAGEFPETMSAAGNRGKLCSVGSKLFLFYWTASTRIITAQYSLDNGATWTAADADTIISLGAMQQATAYTNADGAQVPYLITQQYLIRYATDGGSPELVYLPKFTGSTYPRMCFWPATGKLYFSDPETPGALAALSVTSNEQITSFVGLDQGARLPAARQGQIRALWPTSQWLFVLLQGAGAYANEGSVFALDIYGGWHSIYDSATADVTYPAAADGRFIYEHNGRFEIIYKKTTTTVNGVIASYVLDNPLANTAYIYATTGYVDLPRYAGDLPELTAVWLQARCDADDLSGSTAGEYIAVAYGKDGEARTTNAWGNFLSGTNYLQIASGVGMSSRTIAPRLTFYRDAAVTTHSPKLYGFTVEYLKIPVPRHIFQFVIDVNATAAAQSRTVEEIYDDIEDVEATVEQVSLSAPGVATTLVRALSPSPAFHWQGLSGPGGYIDPLEMHEGIGFVSMTLVELIDLGGTVAISGTSTYSPYLRKSDVDNVPVEGATDVPVSSAWAYAAILSLVPDALVHADVDDVAVDGATTVPISSNWAYDHENAADPHGLYELESNDAADAITAAKTVKLDDFAAPDDNTDRDATTALHGLMPKADKVKLDGIAALADVTGATNVAAAGAVMESDATTAAMSFVIDEDNMASNSATKVPTQQSVKAYADSLAMGALDDLTDVVITAAEQGDMLFRGAAGWENKHHGLSGQVWMSGGHAADPSWTSLSAFGSLSSAFVKTVAPYGSARAADLTFLSGSTEANRDANTDALQELIDDVEALGTPTGIIRFLEGHYDFGNGGIYSNITFSKCKGEGAGSNRTIFHFNDTTGGVICQGGVSETHVGDLTGVTIYTPTSYTGTGLTLLASGVYIIQRNRFLDDIRLWAASVDHTAGGIGFQIHLAGTGSKIAMCQFGHMTIYGYEKGWSFLGDAGTDTYFNSNGFDGIYNTGSLYGMHIENNCTTNASFDGNIFNRLWISDYNTDMLDSLIVTGTNGISDCTFSAINMMDRNSGPGAAIKLNSYSSGNSFSGFFHTKEVVDCGSGNLFFPNHDQLGSVGACVTGATRSGVINLTAAANVGTNPVATVWENPFTDYVLIDEAIVRVSTDPDVATTFDWGVADVTVVEDCEDAWTDGGTGHVTITASPFSRVGTYCNKFVISSDFAAHGADALIAYEDISSKDLSTHIGLLVWIMVTASVAAGDLELVLDETAACATPDQILSLPALLAPTAASTTGWQRVFLPYTTIPTAADRNATISVGLRYHANAKANTVYIDNIVSVGQGVEFGDDLTATGIKSSRTTSVVPVKAGPAGTYQSTVVFWPAGATTGMAGKMYVHCTGV